MENINNKRWQIPEEDDIPHSKKISKILKDDWDHEDTDSALYHQNEDESWDDFFRF